MLPQDRFRSWMSKSPFTAVGGYRAAVHGFEEQAAGGVRVTEVELGTLIGRLARIAGRAAEGQFCQPVLLANGHLTPKG